MFRQLLSESFTKIEMADTASTASSATYEGDKEVQVQISCQESLYQFWNELKQGGCNQTKSLHISFRLSDPYKKISKLSGLKEVFAVIGSLPQLEELAFQDADLLVSYLAKLLKKPSLKSLKLHNCTLIAPTQRDANKQLWKGIQHQQELTCLEILDCHYTSSETQCRQRSTYSYELPSACLQQLSHLQRVVLDECILDNDQQDSFAELLLESASLQELEIRPVFLLQDTDVDRRHQYQAKKQVIRTFMTETVPDCLAVNNTLKKLVISMEDYHLENVYVEAMSTWIEVVQYENSTLKELRATHLPLAAHSEQPDWYAADGEVYEYAESYLHHNLQSILRLNQMFQARQRQEEKQRSISKALALKGAFQTDDASSERPEATEIWV